MALQDSLSATCSEPCLRVLVRAGTPTGSSPGGHPLVEVFLEGTPDPVDLEAGGRVVAVQPAAEGAFAAVELVGNGLLALDGLPHDAFSLFLMSDSFARALRGFGASLRTRSRRPVNARTHGAAHDAVGPVIVRLVGPDLPFIDCATRWPAKSWWPRGLRPQSKRRPRSPSLAWIRFDSSGNTCDC
jgi:hypothetical protein